MKKILITGANGFVGSNICIELLKYEEVLIYAIARSKGNISARDRVLKEITKGLKEYNTNLWEKNNSSRRGYTRE